ncbi:gp53-like domain-containing protein [Citrobacter sedlakii]|uniref:gp53-like domain-containing protein n=1 Tax=Citrobacter sedlakii TaxID=67826 RepID=UPI003DA1549E
MNSFPVSKSKNGWAKLPNGLLVQWGVFAGNTTSKTNGNYPVAFPSAVYITIGVMSDSAQFNNSTNISAINMENTSLTTWGANLTDAGIGNTYRYAFLAIGV